MCLSLFHNYSTGITMSLTPCRCLPADCFQVHQSLFPFCYTPGQARKKTQVFPPLAQAGNSNLASLRPHAEPSPHLLITMKAEPIFLSPLLSTYFWGSLGTCHALPRKLHYVKEKTFRPLLMDRCHYLQWVCPIILLYLNM